MNELETKLAKVKEELKPFNILSYITLGIALVGIVFLILGTAIKNNDVIDILFAAGVGAVVTAIIVLLSICIIENKKYSEYSRLKKEIKKQNNK